MSKKDDRDFISNICWSPMSEGDEIYRDTVLAAMLQGGDFEILETPITVEQFREIFKKVNRRGLGNVVEEDMWRANFNVLVSIWRMIPENACIFGVNKKKVGRNLAD